MTRALILAAGFGTRLGALSDELPKPMLPVCDYPLLRFAIALVAGSGIRELAINLHHRGDVIERALGDGRDLGVAIRYSHEEKILGTGGGIRRLYDFLTDGGREPFVVVNGKILIDVELSSVIARHRATGATATMVVRETPDAARWGAIEVDENGRVSKILDVGTPGAHVCMFTGVHVLSPELVRRLPPDGESDSIRQAYMPALRDGARIEGVLQTGYFHEHSTPERYLQGNWNALAGRAQIPFPPGPLVGVAESAQVAPGAEILPRTKISDGARIEAGARIGPDVVVGARAIVRANARLERVVVWPDSVADGALAGAIVTPKGVVSVTPAPAAPART